METTWRHHLPPLHIILQKNTPSHYHQYRVSGGDRGVAPTHGHDGWHASTGELLESRRISCIRRARGLPQHRLQLGPEERPTDKSMCLRSAMCAGTSLSSRAMCPTTEMWRAAISPSGLRSVYACTSTLLTKSDQRIPSIWRWHFMWKASNAFTSSC